MRTRIYTKNYSYTSGDIHYVELSNEYRYCLKGMHPCLIVDQTMNNVRVIPMTSIKENYTRENERVVQANYTTGLTKISKFLYAQFTTVSTEQIKSRCGQLDMATFSDVIDELKNTFDKTIKPIQNN